MGDYKKIKKEAIKIYNEKGWFEFDNYLERKLNGGLITRRQRTLIENAI